MFDILVNNEVLLQPGDFLSEFGKGGFIAQGFGLTAMLQWLKLVLDVVCLNDVNK